VALMHGPRDDVEQRLHAERLRDVRVEAGTQRARVILAKMEV
jgi:hypothetical protein